MNRLRIATLENAPLAAKEWDQEAAALRLREQERQKHARAFAAEMAVRMSPRALARSRQRRTESK
jgi:hypothetical protein